MRNIEESAIKRLQLAGVGYAVKILQGCKKITTSRSPAGVQVSGYLPVDGLPGVNLNFTFMYPKGIFGKGGGAPMKKELLQLLAENPTLRKSDSAVSIDLTIGTTPIFNLAAGKNEVIALKELNKLTLAELKEWSSDTDPDYALSSREKNALNFPKGLATVIKFCKSIVALSSNLTPILGAI